MRSTWRRSPPAAELTARCRPAEGARGTFAVLDAAGHDVHLEQPELTALLVREWLARVDGHDR